MDGLILIIFFVVAFVFGVYVGKTRKFTVGKDKK